MTVVVPTGKVSLGLCEETKLVTEQLSLTVGAVHVTTALHESASVVCVMLDGTLERVGASASTMVTEKEVVVVLPQSSSAV